MSKLNQTPSDLASECNALSFALKSLIGNYAFIDIVKVEKVNEHVVDNVKEITLTVRSMILGMTTERKKIENEPVYNIPILRLQCGESAVIMDPVVGDIGLMAICDKDIDNIKDSKQESMPGTLRQHNMADGVYLTSIASLSITPTQYVKFTSDGIEIVSPKKLKLESPEIDLTATTKISLNSADITLNGPVTQGAGSYGGAAHFKNAVTSDSDFAVGEIKLTYHGHTGVQTGSGISGSVTAL